MGTRAPAGVIHERNVERRRLHQLAVASNDVRGQRLTQSTLGKVNRGINCTGLLDYYNPQQGTSTCKVHGPQG